MKNPSEVSFMAGSLPYTAFLLFYKTNNEEGKITIKITLQVKSDNGGPCIDKPLQFFPHVWAGGLHQLVRNFFQEKSIVLGKDSDLDERYEMYIKKVPNNAFGELRFLLQRRTGEEKHLFDFILQVK